MRKEITRRQKEFLSQFLDIYLKIDEPIHYSDLAERLDLSKISVYEMLRLLEKRGLIQSEFRLASENRGPGRASVLFQPTKAAVDLLSSLADGAIMDDSWEEAKENILSQISLGEGDEYESLLNDLLVRIPEHRSPLIYLTDMVTATILGVMTIRETAEKHGLLDRLRRIGLPGEIGLSALSGIGSALTVAEDANLKFSTFLFEQSGKYHEILTEMNTENREQLSDFARQLVKRLNR
jgi:DNA-binding MarR family transcriptional regulator